MRILPKRWYMVREQRLRFNKMDDLNEEFKVIMETSKSNPNWRKMADDNIQKHSEILDECYKYIENDFFYRLFFKM